MALTISTKFHTSRTVSSGMAGGLATASRIVLAPLQRAWKLHRDERRLQELSDYQLRDLGIRREQIHDVLRGQQRY